MAVSQIKITLNSDIKKVWEIVTSLENYNWRSDLSKIEKINDKQFVEYTKDGYATTFTITAKEPCKRYEFDMENDNMKGHWTGLFTQKGSQTEIEFTEDVTAKKLIMKPFVKSYLKKQQLQYISDLEEFLLCQNKSETVLTDKIKYKKSRKTKEEFGRDLIISFTNQAMHTIDPPYSDENKVFAMNKFNLTEDEFHCLLQLTDQSWMW